MSPMNCELIRKWLGLNMDRVEGIPGVGLLSQIQLISWIEYTVDYNCWLAELAYWSKCLREPQGSLDLPTYANFDQ